MASLYTDAEREARYSALRTKRRRCDRVFDICMYMALGFGLLALQSTLSFFTAGMATGNITSLALGIIYTAPLIGLVIAIYLKDIRVSVGEFFALFLLLNGADRLAFSGLMIACIATVLTDYFWLELSKEEGFPMFEIGYEEEKERNKALQQYADNRAIAAGVRAENTGTDDEMHDLLDEGHDVQQVYQPLHGMHERFRNAQAYENQYSYVPGVMDTIETPAEPPLPQSQAEMDDITD